VLCLANDGASAGHVARAIAVARGLRRVADRRGARLKLILATTSDADSLIANESLATVRLPNPTAAKRGGLDDDERRRIVRSAIDSLLDSFAPDLVVVDTFPSGPHGELAGIGRIRAKRALVRRHVRNDRANDAALRAGIEKFDLAILADDPTSFESELEIPIRRVPPITMAEAELGFDREKARLLLGLPAQGRMILITTGGGGDANANARGEAIATHIAKLHSGMLPVLALGPLANHEVSSLDVRIRVVRRAPLQPFFAAFDGAIGAAGYNTAHELAKASVPAALFAEPRDFDDQRARAERFREAGLACVLDRFDDDAIALALSWIGAAKKPTLESGGADRAAEALMDLATGVAE
jgi:UDP-N-acetylglucosamine--N-acetylmuramyl-(pentapeptide) pyrophosphoryl-undecaprenol N-acetylglucosamine transferase